eukprot:6205408-Prymnesium_polylepis.1
MLLRLLQRLLHHHDRFPLPLVALLSLGIRERVLLQERRALLEERPYVNFRVNGALARPSTGSVLHCFEGVERVRLVGHGAGGFRPWPPIAQ